MKIGSPISVSAGRLCSVTRWTFLTHHGHVLLHVAKAPDATVEEIASVVGVTTRSALKILKDLETEGYLERERRGRRNHYVLHADRPLRHPSNAAHTVAEILDALGDLH
jgi:predicted ArsR family transcriptional regulator